MTTRIEDSRCARCFHAGAIVDVSGSEPFVTCFAQNAACGRMMKLTDVADCKLYRPKKSEKAYALDRSNMESDWW